MWLLPSFNRPGNLERFFAACLSTGVSTPGMVIVDALDYAANRLAYEAIELPLGWHFRQTRTRTQGDKIREVWNEVSSCAWLGLIGDDNVPETQGWDRRLVDALDGFNIVSCDDGWQAPARLGNCWIMSGELVRAVGFIFAPGMQHLFVDDLWETLGREADCWTCLMDVMVRHRHVMKGEAPADATHRDVYGCGFTGEIKGPDRERGLWAGDEEAYRVWLAGDRAVVVARIRDRRPALEAQAMADPDDVLQKRLARARSRYIMICTPIARHPCYQYTLALTDTVLLLETYGIRHARQFVIGSSNLPRARNELCARFLASPCTHMLFIDDDMGWKANSVVRLLASDKPITALVGRKRVDKPNTDKEVWCGLPDAGVNGSLSQDDMGFVRFLKCGTAFMCISREALLKIIAAHPEWKRKGHSGMGPQVQANYYRFFRFGEDEWETGEDYEFCNAWHELGGEIWVDPEGELSHVGEKAYTGAISALMRPRDAARRLEAAE